MDQKRETREALVRAGVEEFARRGLDAPSLDGICARAGFTRGAFYVHFRDRDDLLAAVMEHLLGTFLEAIVVTADPARDLDRTIARFGELAAAYGGVPAGRSVAGVLPFHQLLDGCRRSARIRQRFVLIVAESVSRLADSVRSGQGGGAVRADVDAERVAAALVVMALGVLAAREAGLPFHARDLAATATEILRPLRAARQESRAASR